MATPILPEEVKMSKLPISAAAGELLISLISHSVILFAAGRHATAAGATAVTRGGPMDGNSTLSQIADLLETAPNKDITA